MAADPARIPTRTLTPSRARPPRPPQATIVARYGADSRQAQLFVPKDELDGAITGAAGLSDTPRVARATAGEGAAPLDASELERLTDWAEAMGAEAAAGAAGGGRRLPQDPGGVRGGVGGR
jgi:hypothetical protein